MTIQEAVNTLITCDGKGKDAKRSALSFLLHRIYDNGYSGIMHVGAANYAERENEALRSLRNELESHTEAIRDTFK